MTEIKAEVGSTDRMLETSTNLFQWFSTQLFMLLIYNYVWEECMQAYSARTQADTPPGCHNMKERVVYYIVIIRCSDLGCNIRVHYVTPESKERQCNCDIPHFRNLEKQKQFPTKKHVFIFGGYAWVSTHAWIS